MLVGFHYGEKNDSDEGSYKSLHEGRADKNPVCGSLHDLEKGQHAD